MSLYIFCPRRSSGAFELTEALDATRIRRFDGLTLRSRSGPVNLEPGDRVVAWGSNLPDIEGVRILNGGYLPKTKREELTYFASEGIPSVQAVSSGSTNAIGRTYHHIGGADLLNPPAAPDFYVKRLEFVKEYRLHSFLGRSIKAGVKIPRDGWADPVKAKALLAEGLSNAEIIAQLGTDEVAHSWIRSFDAGWRICYDSFASNAKIRNLAHKAVKAVGLDFGAVDIGELADGTYRVLEVNRAPGIEGNTIQAYVRAITKWAADESVPADAPEVDPPTVVAVDEQAFVEEPSILTAMRNPAVRRRQETIFSWDNAFTANLTAAPPPPPLDPLNR